MPWKIDENGNAVMDNGNPVWVDTQGNEKAFDYKELIDTRNESIKRKSRIAELEQALSPWADIEDATTWKDQAMKALDTVKNMPQSQQETEEQRKAMRDAIVKPLHERIAKLEAEREADRREIDAAAVDKEFTRSKIVTEKLVDPTMVQDLFSKRFIRKDGRVVGLDSKGEVIFGENGVASFDEALTFIMNEVPYGQKLLNPAPGGAGMQQGGVAPQKNPFSKAHWNATEQNRLFIENPTLAAQLQSSAQ